MYTEYISLTSNFSMGDTQEQKKTPLSEVQKAQREIQKRMVGYIAAGLGLVAGLAWNDAIKSLIERLIPGSGSTVVAKIIYAIILTSVVALVLYYLEKSLEKE